MPRLVGGDVEVDHAVPPAGGGLREPILHAHQPDDALVAHGVELTLTVTRTWSPEPGPPNQVTLVP